MEHKDEKISNLWYLAPILFGVVGGIGAYLDIKDKDPIKARECLVLGIIWTIILAVVIYSII